MCQPSVARFGTPPWFQASFFLLDTTWCPFLLPPFQKCKHRVYIIANKSLYAYDAMTGKTLWVASVTNDIGFAPVVANGDVYVSSYNSQLQAFNAYTGKPVWSTFIGYLFSPSS